MVSLAPSTAVKATAGCPRVLPVRLQPRLEMFEMTSNLIMSSVVSLPLPFVMSYDYAYDQCERLSTTASFYCVLQHARW